MKENIEISVTRIITPVPKEEIINSLLLEQENKCSFCDIDISKYNKYHNHDGKTPEMLCPICFDSQHIELLEPEKAGNIIMISNLSQLELIVLTRTIELIKRLNPEKHAEDIDSALVIRMLIEEGVGNAETYFSEGSSDVQLVAQVMINQIEEDYVNRKEGFFAMKWLPDYSKYTKELDYWYKEMMEDETNVYHPSKWESMLQKTKNKKGK